MSKNGPIRDDLADQFGRALKMLRATIRNIPSEHWVNGGKEMFIPAVIAFHAVESIDFYFSGSAQFEWGKRFRGPWWKIAREALPTKDEMLVYLEEMEEKVTGYFADCDDDDLLKAFDLYDWSGSTWLGHFIYAIRHTMHHQGQLAALQMEFGVEGDTWE